jgi:hypothetical protein
MWLVKRENEKRVQKLSTVKVADANFARMFRNPLPLRLMQPGLKKKNCHKNLRTKICWFQQVMLINAVKDVASALGDLIQATKAASGKSINDPSMNHLKDSAKVSLHINISAWKW